MRGGLQAIDIKTLNTEASEIELVWSALIKTDNESMRLIRKRSVMLFINSEPCDGWQMRFEIIWHGVECPAELKARAEKEFATELAPYISEEDAPFLHRVWEDEDEDEDKSGGAEVFIVGRGHENKAYFQYYPEGFPDSNERAKAIREGHKPDE